MNDPLIWPSHTGRKVPVSEMARPHIDRALTSLRVQEEHLVRMIAGLDPEGESAYRAEMKAWMPVITPQEMMERTRHWIAVLEAEINRREATRWEGFEDRYA